MFNSCLLSSFILVWLWPNWSCNYFYTLPAIIISLTSLIQFDQILTLQASNLTSEDLTLTLLAPASFTSPSVVSLNSPRTPKSPFVGFAEFLARVNGERSIGSKWKKGFNSIIKKKAEQSYDGKAQEVSLSDDVIPSSGISCTHLWLQSRVPLG